MSEPAIDPLAQEMMTLAGIAYGQPANIPAYLADPSLATGGRWRLVWIASEGFVPTNFAFLAEDGTDGRYVVAIRGTYPDPLNPAYWEDASQDNPFGTMVAWPYPADGGALVSRGTWAGFEGVTNLADADGTSLTQALETLPTGALLFVTGHSLGGTLAPVIAQWAKGLTSHPVVRVLSFAGMTPGNGAFADLISAATLRYYNDLDSVPFGWNAVLATKDFYQPAPQGGDLYKAAIDDMAAQLDSYPFAPVGSPQCLRGTVHPYKVNIPFVTFLIENLRQHLPDTYLGLLQAPLLPFTIGFGAVVAPKDHPLAASLPDTVPAHFL